MTLKKNESIIKTRIEPILPKRSQFNVPVPVIKSLYNRILASISQCQQTKISPSLTPVNSKSEIPVRPSFFLDGSIVEEIIKKTDYVYKYNLTLFKTYDIDVSVYLGHKHLHSIINVARNINAILFFMLYREDASVAHNKNKKISITLYLTGPSKGFKTGFRNIIEPKNINSGFYFYDQSVDVGNIIIFREEEWTKVLIHECVHCFNMDFKSQRINFTTFFKDTFNIKSLFLINEAFTEFITRVINVAFYTFIHSKSQVKKDNIEDYVNTFHYNFRLEVSNSLYQSQKILGLFGLEYKDVIDDKKTAFVRKIYQESTNAFTYYVITSILVFNTEKTIRWITSDKSYELHSESSKGLFPIDKSERDVMIFSYFIKQLAKDKEMLKIYNELVKTRVNLPGYNMSLLQWSL